MTLYGETGASVGNFTPAAPSRTGHWQPYADGTSGHSGDTSERAEPTRRRKIDVVYDMVVDSGTLGMTWREVAALAHVHHGSASSALSNLHRTDSVSRLKQTRERCGIYVLPEHVGERETVPYRPRRRFDRAVVEKTVDEWWERDGATRGDLVDLLCYRLGLPFDGGVAG